MTEQLIGDVWTEDDERSWQEWQNADEPAFTPDPDDLPDDYLYWTYQMGEQEARDAFDRAEWV